MLTTHRPNGSIVVLNVQVPRIDAAISMAFKEQARQVIQNETGRVVLDLRKVEFLDSSGLGTLVAIMKMLDGGRRLELASCGDAVRKVLTLTRMDSVFVLHASLNDLQTDNADFSIAHADGQDAA
ncbi:anti-sigma B factor antagonist [Jannaschia faecimaris]|uniref:Anti-sigma factor antagonist n=1 Tax=Jannaschia faecimaris TaxID=1244108 RepID=A0A1H3PYT4_9RHOB|nr:STAS domain-containing protein [Jannaschia faecimaris]SDZ05965.1 anti-sigma B factor antagonist [Jannaschia faecimaris]